MTSSSCYCGFYENVHDASLHEVSQIINSGCGVTAVLNSLVALKISSIKDIAIIDISSGIVRFRDNDAPLVSYLQSRSVAGCTGAELILSMTNLLLNNNYLLRESQHVVGIFYTLKEFAKQSSLIEEIKIRLNNSEVLIATLNLQLLGNDAWHHQMIYAVDTNLRLIYCMNPVGAYPEDLFLAMLSTESVLLIRREDILSRFLRPGSNWSELQSGRWSQLEVSKQIESLWNESEGGGQSVSHIVIPANYIGGIVSFRINEHIK